MRKIELTQGLFAFVDDADYERISQHKWYAHKDHFTYYAVRQKQCGIKKQKTISMHHEIIGHPGVGRVTDHIDGNGLNNQRNNLRHVSSRVNSNNTRARQHSSLPGVTWHIRDKKWMAQIRIGGRKKFLGLFKQEDDAFQAYRFAVESLGEKLECPTIGGQDG